MAQVTIYTTPTCGYCKMAKEFFKENNVEYNEKDVAADQKAQQELLEKSGRLAVPVIEVDGNVVVGFNREKLAELLGIS